MFHLRQNNLEWKQEEITKPVTLKERSPDETKVRGTLAPFRLQTPRPLMEVAYYCGFGGLNAQGFGMVKRAPLPR